MRTQESTEEAGVGVGEGLWSASRRSNALDPRDDDCVLKSYGLGGGVCAGPCSYLVGPWMTKTLGRPSASSSSSSLSPCSHRHRVNLALRSRSRCRRSLSLPAKEEGKGG